MKSSVSDSVRTARNSVVLCHVR